jgi:hypothetical protein
MGVDMSSYGNRTRSPRLTRPTKTFRHNPSLPLRGLWRKPSSAATTGPGSTFPERSPSKCPDTGPAEQYSLSDDAAWLAQPATEKQKEYIRALYGDEESGPATELVIDGHRISIDDLSKGKAAELM